MRQKGVGKWKRILVTKILVNNDDRKNVHKQNRGLFVPYTDSDRNRTELSLTKKEVYGRECQ